MVWSGGGASRCCGVDSRAWGERANGEWDTSVCEDGSVCGGEEVFGVKIGITGDETDAAALPC